MPKSIATGVLDQALQHIQMRATRMCLCAGAPASADAAVTQTGAGGAMLADLQLTPANAANFAITTTASGERRLIVGGQTEIIGHQDGVADHLAVVDTAGGELLVVTELTETQPVLPGAIIATRPFTVTLGNP